MRRVSTYKKMLGAQGEDFVVEYLLKQGCIILDRNWRIKEGEIDIVSQYPNGVVAFVEVKTRSSLTFGHPIEGIGIEKSMRLQRLALAWLCTNKMFGADYQIDCAGVLAIPNHPCELDYRSAIL